MISYKEKIAEILAPHVDGLEKDPGHAGDTG